MQRPLADHGLSRGRAWASRASNLEKPQGKNQRSHIACVDPSESVYGAARVHSPTGTCLHREAAITAGSCFAESTAEAVIFHYKISWSNGYCSGRKKPRSDAAREAEPNYFRDLSRMPASWAFW